MKVKCLAVITTLTGLFSVGAGLSRWPWGQRWGGREAVKVVKVVKVSTAPATHWRASNQWCQVLPESDLCPPSGFVRLRCMLMMTGWLSYLPGQHAHNLDFTVIARCYWLYMYMRYMHKKKRLQEP